MSQKTCSFVVASAYQKNKLFDLSDRRLNRDDCLAHFSMLKNELELRGFQVATSDILAPGMATATLYLDAPDALPPIHLKRSSFLLIQESEVIQPRNWMTATHDRFERIFTWHTQLAKKAPFVKYHWPQVLKQSLARSARADEPRFLAGLIASNKTSPHPLELYSAREKTIRWFEQNHPEEFCFYGMGWDRPLFLSGLPLVGKRVLARRLENLVARTPLGRLLRAQHPCYLGPVEEKMKAYKQFKFAICYENAHGIPGYITEKLFDCLCAGVVPVYWGAPDIEEYVPPQCFVDRRTFTTDAEMYEALKTMSRVEYGHRLDAIREFLSSEAARKFSGMAFATHIASQIEAVTGTRNV